MPVRVSQAQAAQSYAAAMWGGTLKLVLLTLSDHTLIHTGLVWFQPHHEVCSLVSRQIPDST